MQYMLLIYDEDSGDESLPEEELHALYQEYFRLSDDLRVQGKLVASEELASVSTATSVQVRGGDTVVSDGPFAETKEVLGGFYLIDSDSLDEAIEWASRVPAARTGTVEIRPLHDNSEHRE